MSEDSLGELRKKYPMFLTMEQLDEVVKIEERKSMDVLRDKKGWSFNSELLTLELRETAVSPLMYDIDLKGINSTAEMLDWIFHLHDKDTNISYELVDAFQTIFNPCMWCCSFGKEKKFSGTKLARAFAKRFNKLEPLTSQ